MSVTVLIPAHNEEQRIGAAILGLHAQTCVPNRIVVVCDNCSDHTEQIAQSYGADVFKTSNNRLYKAGALNQAFDLLSLEDDKILVQDADTILRPQFLEVALRWMADESIGAIGGVFYGESGGGILGLMQRNEYARYAREIGRKQARCTVLTGTASVFRLEALYALRKARQTGALPGTGGVYDTSVLTEDNEITLAIKTLGYRCFSPKDCAVETEIMPTVRQLWRQRLRWQRGAIENLRNYGWTRVTRPYILRQGLMALSVLSLALFLTFFVWSSIATGQLNTSPLWLGIGWIFVTERIVTVRRLGLVSMLVAAPLAIELVYDVFQHVVYVKCVIGAFRKSHSSWGSDAQTEGV